VAGTTLINSDKAALLGTQDVSLKSAHGVDNAGLIYGNGRPPSGSPSTREMALSAMPARAPCWPMPCSTSRPPATPMPAPWPPGATPGWRRPPRLPSDQHPPRGLRRPAS
jgi:hypothetical protein